eukprot:TRINITY_DN2223_c0_g2_i1.p1 TRINITY_DN2223_c0_g2~~TRINITY_DN2223_c0_g2_i1.p1  ORF type:complete len:622 (-),score=48.73 TRINITY_DN2223_c0_g2_i1:307-2172(-)
MFISVNYLPSFWPRQNVKLKYKNNPRYRSFSTVRVSLQKQGAKNNIAKLEERIKKGEFTATSYSVKLISFLRKLFILVPCIGKNVDSILASIESDQQKKASNSMPIARGDPRIVTGQPFIMPLFQLYQIYGPVFLLSFGVRSIVIVSDPGFAKQILFTNASNYSKGLLSEVLDFVMGTGLIPANGGIWIQIIVCLNWFVLFNKQHLSMQLANCTNRRFCVTNVSASPTPSTGRSPASTGSLKRAMTMTEKILGNHSGAGSVAPGQNIWVSVDKLMTHDVCGPGTFGVFQKEFGMDAQVWDPEKVIIIPDHYIFTADERANRNVDMLRDFAQKYNIKYFYDIKDLSDFKVNPDYKGVCHIALAQEGHCVPGEVLLGTDSHTCNAGAFGQFASGIGNTDAGFVLGTGKILLKVPPTLKFVLDGEMPDYLLAKDLILHIIGEISVSGATYKAMEFGGTAVEAMNMDERMTICNMVVEAGGKNGVIAPDQTTFDFVKQRTSASFEPVYSDEGADYIEEYRFNVEELEPVVAAPHSPDNRKKARECKDVKIDRVYIGSCTGGKTEDFMAAAKLFHKAGQEVKVPTYLAPATRKVWEQVYLQQIPECDNKTCAQIFEEVGQGRCFKI